MFQEALLYNFIIEKKQVMWQLTSLWISHALVPIHTLSGFIKMLGLDKIIFLHCGVSLSIIIVCLD